jgi:hypothetical protein
MFLGLPYPDLDPLVRGRDPDPDPDPSIIKKNRKKNFEFYYSVTLFYFLCLKNVSSKSISRNFFLN